MATSARNAPAFNFSIAQRQEILEYAKRCYDNQHQLATFRQLLVYRDMAYQRTLDATTEQIKAFRSNRYGDARKLQNMAVPIVMPQVESATAYQAGVFLSSWPIFGVVASPKYQSEATQFETTLGDQATKFGWSHNLIRALRNGFKYNFGPVVVQWREVKASKVITDLEINTAGNGRFEETKYAGNEITSVDPYNCFMDMSVEPGKMHSDGEFFGYSELYTRMKMIRFIQSLPSERTTQIKEAYASQYTPADKSGAAIGRGIYVPNINQYLNTSDLVGVQDWLQSLHLEKRRDDGQVRINYKSHYVVTRFFFRALPSDFGRSGNKPTIYYVVIINWQYVVYVEEIASVDDFLPVMIATPFSDGLSYQTQSMIDTALPYQDMSSALWNISLEGQRRNIFDRLLYNPRMVDKKDIDPASSVSRIPIRNVGMNDQNPFSRAVFQVPYRNDTAGQSVQMAQLVEGMADSATGQNKVDRGQFQKGNKTTTEFNTTMAGSNARQQLTAIVLENQFFTPMKSTIKGNTLYHQSAASIVNQDSKQVVDIDPTELRKALLEFKITDGVLPADKLMNMELMTVFLQTAQAMPVLMTEYDVMGMFIYWMKLRGAAWVDDFKRQPNMQQNFLTLFRQTSEAQNATPQPPAPPAGNQQQVPGIQDVIPATQ